MFVGVYFAAVMIMCTISVMMTVIVLNFHHRKPDMYSMSPWVLPLLSIDAAADDDADDGDDVDDDDNSCFHVSDVLYCLPKQAETISCFRRCFTIR